MWELLINAILGIATGAAGAGINNAIAGEREESARAANYNYSKMSGNDADRRTRALYNDLYSPKAQYNQIKEIGLSPSYYYSNGAAGISGQSGAVDNGAASVQPNIYGIDATMLAQLENMRADTELKKAEANKTNEEANTEAGNNLRGASEIENIIAQTGNYNAMSNYAQTQNELIKLTQESTISEAKSNAAIAAYKAKQSFYEMMQSGVEMQVSEETKNARIEKQKESVKLIISQRLKNYKEMNLTDAQINEISANISMLYDHSMREWALTDAVLQNADTFSREIDQKQRQFEQQLTLELDKWGFDKDHWFKNKLVDLSGDLIHAGGYIIGLSMMKGGKNAGKLGLKQTKGQFDYGMYNPKFNGKVNGVTYKNGLLQIPTVYF